MVKWVVKSASFIALLLVITLPPRVYAQLSAPSVSFSIVHKWQISPQICNETDGCTFNLRISDDGSLFIYNKNKGLLYHFQESSDKFSSYDLNTFMSSWSQGLNFDFIPFGSDYVLLFNGLPPQIYKYSLSSLELTPVILHPETELERCFPWWLASPRSFLRFGNSSSLLVCTVQEIPQYIGMAELNSGTSQLTPIGSMHRRDSGIDFYWYRVVAGWDGITYQQLGTKIVWGTVVNFANSSLTVPESSFAPYDKDRHNGLLHWFDLVGVDSHANFYFELSWLERSNSQNHFVFGKISSTGEYQWKITENDLGGGDYRFIGIDEDGKFFILKMINSPSVYFEVQQVTVVTNDSVK